MIRRRLSHLAFGASAAIMLGLTPSLAQEAPVCSFICKLTGQPGEQAAAPPAAAPEPAVEAPATTPTTTSAPKAKAKPKLVPVSIATGEPEAAATRALAAGLKVHPVRIVAAAAPAADLVVGPRVEAAGSSRPAAPLFREELHVVGATDLKNLADLQGRSVSLGADGSPTQAVARKILAARHITIKEVPLDLDNALDGLATGDLDAVAFFAPQPFGRLNDLAGGGRLHLLATASSAEDDPGLAPAFIPTSAYPALTSGVATPTLSVAVDVMASARSGHPREAAAVVAALAAKARKTLAAQPAAEMRSVAVSR